MRLKWLLAGPILRRTEPAQVCIWLATSAPASIRGEVVPVTEGASARLMGAGDADTVQMGSRLFVHLVRMRPEHGEFPTDCLLGYDLVLRGEVGTDRRLRDLGLLDGPASIAYGDLPLPTFFIRHSTRELTVLHGSCRQLHGGGTDALATADAFVAEHAEDPERRPCSLFLTGDQIYADDVPGPLVRHLDELGRELIGPGDDVPGVPPAEEIPLNGRSELARDAGFTSPKAANHLFRLGEFAAMYITAWNERTWPETLPDEKGSIGGRNPAASAMARRKYRAELRALERTRAGIPGVRRLLANTPTYMVFDDHDVTDDWNITGAWRSRVESSLTGRRTVANALAAYWGFQGWGNDPDRMDGQVRAAIAGRADGTVSAEEFDRAMWAFDRWSFVAPTDPPTLFLDTRTRRGYDSPEGGARLIRREDLHADAELARAAGHESGRPLVLVSPVPICGLEIVERRQKYLVKELGPYAIDFEAWHSNLRGFVDLVCALLDDLELPWAVSLSGDVHYGFTVNITVESDGRTLPITQLVSSPIRHSGALSRFALAAIGLLTRERHERVGWDRPPAMSRPAPVRRRLLARPSNTDDWNDDAPVFVAPTLAETLGVTEPPRYREWRAYAPIDDAKPSLIGLNNVGLMSMSEGTVTHRLLAWKSERIRMFTTRVDSTRDDSNGETKGAELVARGEGRSA